MKKLKYFKNIDPVDDSGVVAWSPSLESDQIIEAYQNGIFPWPNAQGSVCWFSPLMRGILKFKDLKWSKKDLKFFKKTSFVFKINANFKLAIETCAKAKISQKTETWITSDVIEAYTDLHQQGAAISFETYEGEDLVGGIYGVLSKNYFSAESMFYLKSNASKFALFNAVEFLSGIGMAWIDTQVVTDFTSQLGAKVITRQEFLELIK